MNEIIDKVLLFLCCLTLYILNTNNGIAIVAVIISIILSSLFFYYDDYRFRIIGTILYAVLCFILPSYIIFLPLLLYDLLHTRYQYTVLFVPLLFICHYTVYDSLTVSFTLLFLAVAYLAKNKTDRLNHLYSDFNELRDNSAKMSLLLEEKNRDLLKNQDYEINLATLNERNRISKEIHDNIGHLLSRALLQVGALMIVSKDEAVKEGLSDLKESLSVGMDQIRSSIHNMYDESIDLYVQIEALVKNFAFCDISYDYDIKNQPSLQLKQSMIAITKESLANVIRHSKATKVQLVLREHPAMYQLIISDNGAIDQKSRKVLAKTYENQEYSEGMGLRNIYDRVKSFNGNININLDQGFRLFITIPKKQSKQGEV